MMALVEEFRQMTRGLDLETLSGLCERFVCDHQCAIDVTKEFASNYKIDITETEIQKFIIQIHENRDFDKLE